MTGKTAAGPGMMIGGLLATAITRQVENELPPALFWIPYVACGAATVGGTKLLLKSRQ